MPDIPNEQKALEERLSRENFGIVVSQALKFPPNMVCDLEDYIQVGAQAFILATRSWKDNRGTKWSTYVTTCVHRAISKESFKFKHALSASHQANKLACQVHSMLQNGSDAFEIADTLGINVKSVSNLKSLLTEVSYYTHELVKDDSMGLLKDIAEGLLSHDEYRIMELRLERNTFEQIGDILSIDKEYARRTVKKSLQKIKDYYERQEENFTV